MSTWEDLESFSSNSEEETSISLMIDVADNSMSEDSDNEVDFTDIDSLHLAYQEAMSNKGMIASAYKTMKRKCKNACKEIELMQQEKASLNDISLKNAELLQEERLCNENRNLKNDLAVQNTNIKNLEKELVLIREKLGKRPIESNETNIDDIITENIALRKNLSHSNTNEKSLNMLIKSSRKSHDKKGIACDQNNASSSSSIVHPISEGTFKDKSLRKTNMKGPKTEWVPKEKIIPLADILNPNKKTQIFELGKWMLIIHKGKKFYIPRIKSQETERQEKKMNEICWNWSNKDETFIFY